MPRDIPTSSIGASTLRHIREAIAIAKTGAQLLLKRISGKRRLRNFPALLFDALARTDYYPHFLNSDRERFFEHVIRRYCSSEYSLLDLGCGVGTFEVLAAKRIPSLSVTCVDISLSMLNITRVNLKLASEHRSARLLNADFSEGAPLSGAFDVVLCSAVNRFIYRPNLFFHRLHGLLAEEGIAVFRTLKVSPENVVRVLIWTLLTLRLRPSLLELDFFLTNTLVAHGFNVTRVDLRRQGYPRIAIIEARHDNASTRVH